MCLVKKGEKGVWYPSGREKKIREGLPRRKLFERKKNGSAIQRRPAMAGGGSNTRTKLDRGRPREKEIFIGVRGVTPQNRRKEGGKERSFIT